MSHQPGGMLPNNNPVFKEPHNLDMIHDVLVLPSEHELLSSSADIRICKFIVCLSEDSAHGVLPEDKDYRVTFFGDIQSILNGDSLEPVPLEEFMEPILSQSGVNVEQQPVSIWVTTSLETPAVPISTDRRFADFFISCNDYFHRDPLSYAVLYFFVDFNGSSDAGSSEIAHLHTPPPFLKDQEVDHNVATGGVSPRHVPTPTLTGYETTGHEPSRRHSTTRPDYGVADTTPIKPPKRVTTLESGKKALNKLIITVKNVPSTVKQLVSPREAPQDPTTPLTELASRIDQEDYLTSLLPRSNGRPEYQAELDAYQTEQFERFCRFFPHIDPTQRENTRSIRFKHTKLTVTPHQFTRAMEILFQDHTTGGLSGGILASDMGTGKSFIILCTVVLRSILFESRRRAEREWDEVETREQSLKRGSNVRPIRLDHLPRNAPRGRGLKCPTQSQRPLDCECFCQPDSATRTQISRLKRGVALIQVPSASMPAWLSTLEDANFSRMAYNFQVLYSGPPLSSRLQPSPEFLRGKNSKWKMGAVLPEGHPGGIISRPQELTWMAQSADLSHSSSMAMETYIVVTSHNSTQLTDLFSWHINELSPAPQNCQFPPEGLPAVPLGIVFIDEAHKVLGKDSVPLRMAALNRRVLPTPSATTVGDVWLVSGTPFGGQLEDLAAAVSWFAPDRAQDATALVEAYNAIEPAMTNRGLFEMLFNRVFGGQLTIRDDRDTTFQGSRITDIRNVRPQYISRETPQNQSHYVRMLMTTKVTVGPPDAYFDTLQELKQNTQLLYLLSMFPGAAKALLDSPDTPFTDLDMRRMIRREKNTVGESLTSNKTFRSLAEKLSKSPRSPKLQYILDELDRLDRDRTPRPQLSKAGASAHVQDDLTMKKLVIITPTVFTAVMLYVILARYHPRTRPLLYHEDLKQSQRADVLRRFNSLRKRDGPCRVFIAPASVASEALNLQIANRLILTSPLLNAHQESQALARVNRVGQVLDVQLKILLLEDSPIDRIVVAHRANAKFLSDPFNVVEPVKVVSLNDDSGSTLAG